VQERTFLLEASREEALEAARAKSAFLATMSHEIRTPLNGVVGMSALLAETRLSSEQREYLKTIRLSSDQLLGVINDILDFSKIESGKMELEAEPLRLRDVVEEACDIVAPRAREKGLELIVDVTHDHEQLPQGIRSDVTRIRQILINYLNNAIKFTEKGDVRVAVDVAEVPLTDSEPWLIRFSVKDTGIGIPPDRMNRLFQSFSQVDSSTTRKYGGTGLGLAICARLAQLMGGKVGVESQVGQGSTFWFTLSAPTCEDGELPSPVREFGDWTGKRILIVDDNEINQFVATEQVEQPVHFEPPVEPLESQCAGHRLRRGRARCIGRCGRFAAARDHHRHAHARH
jgi:signal transduction histidine kinase